jgi:hypothetical protein
MPSKLTSYWLSNPGNLLQLCYQTVTKARAVTAQQMGETPTFFLLSLALADPEQSAKGLQMDTMENTWDKFQKQLQTEKEFSNECLECVQPVRDCVCEDFDYEGTISFTTNKKLTPEQLDQLMDIISLQIIEPVDADQNDEDYSTRGVEVTVKEVE